MNNEGRARRRRKIRVKVRGTAARPRAVVFRSNRNIAVQLVNDERNVTVLSASSIREPADGKVEQAAAVGREAARQAKEKQIREVVFDRAGYRYQGRVRALAEAMRQGGLKF